MYTLGIWSVKPGKEADFIKLWENFAKWTSNQLKGAGTGRLVQDLDNPQKFISFGPWDSIDAIHNWRGQKEFKDFIVEARKICDEIKPGTFKLVASTD